MTLESLIGTGSIDIERPTYTKDQAGGMVVSAWNAIGTAVKARVDTASSSQKVMFASLQIEVSHTVFTFFDDVQNGDRIITPEGEILRVIGITKKKAIGGIQKYYEIPCVQIGVITETYMLWGETDEDVMLWGETDEDVFDYAD